MSIEKTQLKQIIEGAILAAGEPLSLDRMIKLFDEEVQPEKSVLKEVIAELQTSYDGRGFELKEVASGYRFQVCADLAPWVRRLWAEKAPRYSRAYLETLALIAYRQPITRAEIEDVRGVAVSSNIIKSLQEREWIRVVGQRDVPGKPSLLGTTKHFLDYFNLKSLSELPSLKEIQDLDNAAEQLEEQLELNMAQPVEIAEEEEQAEVDEEVDVIAEVEQEETVAELEDTLEE